MQRLLALIEPEFRPVAWQAFRKQAIDGASAEAVAAELGLSVNAVLIAKSRVLSLFGGAGMRGLSCAPPRPAPPRAAALPRRREQARIQNEFAQHLDPCRAQDAAPPTTAARGGTNDPIVKALFLCPSKARRRSLGPGVQTAGGAIRGVVGRAAHGVCPLHACSSTRRAPEICLASAGRLEFSSGESLRRARI